MPQPEPGARRASVPTPGAETPLTARQLRLARATRKRARPKPPGNPLREGLRLERMPDPAAFVLFGATGDLAHRKVVPALFQLWRTNLLPHEFHLVAIGRRAYTDDSLRAELRASLEEFSRALPVESSVWDAFAERITYHRGDFGDQGLYESLAARLDAIDAGDATRGNRLYYLATQPSAFAEIIAGLGQAGLDHEQHGGGWRRIVIEKPFGRDLTSAIRLNREVGKVFREAQVYRIDHYLGKETVQQHPRLPLRERDLRADLEPPLRGPRPDHRGRVDRGGGARVVLRGGRRLRDILQNHLMQLLALVAMEPPATFDADALRDEKVKVLRAIEPMTPRDVEESVVRGQYGSGWVLGEAVAGYREEPEVDPESETETYLAARFAIDNWRWAGVPFYLRAGKRLPKRATEIAVQFKQVPHALFEESNADPEANLLALRIQPDEGILLRFAAKVPGLGLDVRSVNMDFTYGSAFSVDSPDAYETLILDALLGDASLFTRADEVEKAWGIVTPIIEAWAEQPAPDFPSYAAGTWGPEAADGLVTRDNRRWRRI